MRSFLEFLSEATAIYTPAPGGIKLSESGTIAKINADLHRLSSIEYDTPYVALERVRKVLANFSLSIPGVSSLHPEGDEDYFPLTQFGEVSGISDLGDKVESDPYHFLYFGWIPSEITGCYEIHAEVLTEEQIEELNSEE